MKRFDAISNDALTDQVTRKIQDLIWKGEILPGELLPSQQVLAAQFGVGLSTIREAIKGLTFVGLVEVRAGRGTRVLPDALKILNDSTLMKASLGSIEAEQVNEARLAIEGTLTQLAANRATEQDIADIEKAFQEMRASVEDDLEFVRADIRFHMAVARASKNDILMQTYMLISRLLEEVVRQADELPGGKDRALTNHARILQGIKDHKPEVARLASEQQIADAIEFYNRKKT